MIVALAQNAPHPPAWTGLASVLFILLGCIVLLLLPNSAWEVIGRVLRGEAGLGAPFDLDDGELAEAVGLTIEPWEPETGAFASAQEAELEAEAERPLAVRWEPEIIAPPTAEPHFIEVHAAEPETAEIEAPEGDAADAEATVAEAFAIPVHIEIPVEAAPVEDVPVHDGLVHDDPVQDLPADAQPTETVASIDAEPMEAAMPQADAPQLSAPEVIQSAFFRPRTIMSEPVAVAPAEPVQAEAVEAAPAAPAPVMAEAVVDTASDLLDRRCRMDLAATREGLELVVELPGLEEKDIDIQVSDDVLTISGELKIEPGWADKTYRLMERDYGAFSRSIELPEGVRADRIRAAMHRGLLIVTIPNPTRPEPRRIEIEAPTQPLRLVETPYGVEVSLDLPGFEESDVEVAVNEGVLTVRGERRTWTEGEADAAPATFSRTIELPEGANPDYISAALAKGVLTVRIPNPVRPEARRIPVQAAA